MFAERFRDTKRDFHARRNIRGLGYVLQPAFDLSNVFEIFVETRAVGTGKGTVQTSHLLRNGVEDAGPRLFAREPLLRIAAIAEEALENHSRVSLMGKGLRRRRPGNGVDIRAAIAPGTGGERTLILALELQGRQHVRLAVLLRDDLIDGRAKVDIGADRFFRLGAAEN